MLAQQFDAYGDIVPYMRSDDRGTESGSGVHRRGRIGLSLFWLTVVLVVLVRIAYVSTAQSSGFANVEGARQAYVR
jgi:hypothetical protein